MAKKLKYVEKYKSHQGFFEDWKLFDPKSAEIYQILCFFSVYYNKV